MAAIVHVDHIVNDFIAGKLSAKVKEFVNCIESMEMLGSIFQEQISGVSPVLFVLIVRPVLSQASENVSAPGCMSTSEVAWWALPSTNGE